MCGRYEFSTEKNAALARIWQSAARRAQGRAGVPAAGEMLPAGLAPVLVVAGGRAEGRLQRWGIRNRYGKTMINARAETAAEKPMFRQSLAAQRCAVPASGFFEWDAAGHKYRFAHPDGAPLYLAGLYDNVDGEDCFVILTTTANACMAPIHDRMPLVLLKEQVRPWLCDPMAALALLAQTPPLLERSCTDGQLRMDGF